MKLVNMKVTGRCSWAMIAVALLLLSYGCAPRQSSSESDVIDVLFRQSTIDDSGASDREFYGDVKGVGDIDGDGYLDIIFGGNELAWYAYPSWRKSLVSISDEQFSTDMQLADVDSDGDLDIVVPDGRRGKLCWFENPLPSGDPADLWECHVIGYQGDWTHDVEVGDINGDGSVDVLTRKGETILWLQGNTGSFSRVVVETALPGGEGTALADMNADGRLDIVQNGYWLEGPVDTVHGAWTKHVIAEGLATQLSVGVADINGDGILDVLLAPAESAGRVSWYRGPPFGSTEDWVEHVIDDDVEFVHSLRVGDFNNDGQPDVVTAEMHQSSQKRVTLYLKEGYSIVWRKQIVSTNGSHNLRVGDVGTDGDLDIVGANWGGDYHPLEIWENTLIEPTNRQAENRWQYVQVDGARGKWGDYAEPAYLRYLGLAAGDVTGDGEADIVSGRYVYENPGKVSNGSWRRTDLGVNVDAMLLLDIDQDSKPDVIAESLPSIYWLVPPQNGAGKWRGTLIGTIPPTEHVNSQGYGVAQLFGDDRPEVILTGGDGVYGFEIPANPHQEQWTRWRIAAGTSEEGFGTGDVDGDGDFDLFATTKDGHTLWWWENPGHRQGDWAKHPIGTTAEWADRIAAADINQDGRLDVVVTEETRYSGASVYWFEQPDDLSKTAWPRHRVVTQFSTNSLDVADLDGDGDPDLVTGEHRGTRKLAIWENLMGGSTWKEHVIDIGKENHLGARVVNLNSSGAIGIVGIGWDTYPYLHLWTAPKLNAWQD